MQNVIVDLNVIIDFVNQREQHQEAARVVDLCVRKTIRGLLCAHEFTTLAYFLLKEHRGQERVHTVLRDLLNIFPVVPVNEGILREALLADFNDYEDAVIEACARKEKATCIITRNTRDFIRSRVPALTPGKFLQAFE
jgi:predicted nucleic acid-binding protein